MKIICCKGMYIPSLIVLLTVGVVANHGNGTAKITSSTDGNPDEDEIKNLNTTHGNKTLHQIKLEGRFYYFYSWAPVESESPRAVLQTREPSAPVTSYFDDGDPSSLRFNVIKYEGQDLGLTLNFTVKANVSIQDDMYFASYRRGKRVDIYKCTDKGARTLRRSFDCVCSVCEVNNKDYAKTRVRSQPKSYIIDNNLQVSMDMVLYDLRKEDDGTVFTFIVNGQNITYVKLIVRKQPDLVVKDVKLYDDDDDDVAASDSHSTVSIGLGVLVLVLFIGGALVVGCWSHRKNKLAKRKIADSGTIDNNNTEN